MYRSNCGGELPPDSTFCRKCGVVVSATAQAEEVNLERPGIVTLLATLNYIAGGFNFLVGIGLIAFMPSGLKRRSVQNSCALLPVTRSTMSRSIA